MRVGGKSYQTEQDLDISKTLLAGPDEAGLALKCMNCARLARIGACRCGGDGGAGAVGGAGRSSGMWGRVCGELSLMAIRIGPPEWAK